MIPLPTNLVVCQGDAYDPASIAAVFLDPPGSAEDDETEWSFVVHLKSGEGRTYTFDGEEDATAAHNEFIGLWGKSCASHNAACLTSGFYAPANN